MSRYVGMWKANFIAAIAAITLKSYLQLSTIDSFVDFRLRRDDLLLFDAGRLDRIARKTQLHLIGRVAATLRATAPKHVDQMEAWTKMRMEGGRLSMPRLGERPVAVVGPQRPQYGCQRGKILLWNADHRAIDHRKNSCGCFFAGSLAGTTTSGRGRRGRLPSCFPAGRAVSTASDAVGVDDGSCRSRCRL
jgi:hypothetical protein